ncbi:MAG: hypothetical protein ABI855_14710, partial [Bacteroidota bacterium]
ILYLYPHAFVTYSCNKAITKYKNKINIMKNKNSYFSMIYFAMLLSVIDFCLALVNVTITNSLIPLKEGVAFLVGKRDAILNLISQKQTAITGYAAQKKAMKKALITYCEGIFAAAAAFAAKTKNDVLLKEVNLTVGDMENMGISNLIGKVQGAINAIIPYLTDLAPYQITDISITTMQHSVDDLQKVISSPNNAIKLRKTINDQIQTLLAECVIFMTTQLDKLVKKVGLDFPQYRISYFNNRRLNRHGRHTNFRVFITDELNQGVYNANVLQIGTDNSATTAINGECTLRLKSQKDSKGKINNVYGFTITSENQQVNTGFIEIKKGSTISRSYIIQPSGFIIPAPVNENVNA